MMDEIDALTPAEPCEIMLGGRPQAIPSLTLGRFAAARRFARAFEAVLTAPDLWDALDRSRDELCAAWAAATGVDQARIAEARADEAMAAFFALTRALRDFTGGPLTAALTDGVRLLVGPATAAPAGAPSSPGSSGGDTPLPN
jgi:hypothetical protein